MKKPILKVKNVYMLSKEEQKGVNGGVDGISIDLECGGDGSFIFDDKGNKVCCYIPGSWWEPGSYIC